MGNYRYFSSWFERLWANMFWTMNDTECKHWIMCIYALYVGMTWLKGEKTKQMATISLLYVFFSLSLFYSCWWRLCGRPVRSLSSAEWTWLSSHPLSMRIICHSPCLSLHVKWNCLSNTCLYIQDLLASDNLASFAEGWRARQMNKNIYSKHMQDTFRCTHATITHRRRCMPLSALFLSSFSQSSHLLPRSIPPSCAQIDSLGEEGEQREKGRPWINEQANKWAQDR